MTTFPPLPTAIVQGPTLDPATLEQAAALAMANQLRPRGPQAGALIDIDPDQWPALQAWAQSRSLDLAFFAQGLAPLNTLKVVAMDMDSTLINIECIDEIAAVVGKQAEVARITEAAMRGDISDFAHSLKARVALLAGVPAQALEQVYTQRLRLNPGAERLITTLRQAGIYTLLVSGGFTFFTQRLQTQLGLDEAYANTLAIDDQGRLTGEVLGDILDGAAKARHLQRVAHALGATPAQCMAIGDGANDLAMMACAHYAVAYRAKPAVQAQANFRLNHSGLDAVLQWFSA